MNAVLRETYPSLCVIASRIWSASFLNASKVDKDSIVDTVNNVPRIRIQDYTEVYQHLLTVQLILLHITYLLACAPYTKAFLYRERFVEKMAFLPWTRTAVMRGLSVPLWTRNISATSSLSAQAKTTKVEDPVQKLFVEKLREYKEKSKGGSLPQASPEFMAKYREELDRVRRQYGGGDMESFPKIDFKD